MKKRWITIAALLGFSTACICISKATQIKEDPVEMTEENSSQLTNEELSVLTSLSVNEERVRKGQLSEWQMQLLKEMRAVKDFLAQKYPSSDFTILKCTTTSTSEGSSSFLFTEAAQTGRLFDAYCTPGTDPSEPMEIRDNYYRVFLEEPLKKLLSDTLAEQKVMEIRCSYSAVLGTEADETITLESAVQKKLPVQPTIQVFFDGTGLDKDSADDLIDLASEKIKALLIPGFYVLHVKEESVELARTSFAI